MVACKHTERDDSNPDWIVEHCGTLQEHINKLEKTLKILKTCMCGICSIRVVHTSLSLVLTHATRESLLGRGENLVLLNNVTNALLQSWADAEEIKEMKEKQAKDKKKKDK